jgi:hypothetical protein
MTDDDLTVRELGSRLCGCGVRKLKGNAFCTGCYDRLPAALQRDLYRQLDEGYLDAYHAAVAYLRATPPYPD